MSEPKSQPRWIIENGTAVLHEPFQEPVRFSREELSKAIAEDEYTDRIDLLQEGLNYLDKSAPPVIPPKPGP